MGCNNWNLLVDNHAEGNSGDGFHVSDGAWNTLTSNVSEDNTGHGFHLLDASNNAIDDNTALRSVRGIAVNDSVGNSVVNNLVKHNDYQGISVVAGSAGNVTVDNTSRNNGTDLFQDPSSQAAGNTFTDNTYKTSSGVS